jgi:hypothetical protein
MPRGRIFSHVRPFYEWAVSDLDRYMHRSLWVLVTHSSFIERSHMTKNTASAFRQTAWISWIFLSPFVYIKRSAEKFFFLSKLGLGRLFINIWAQAVKVIKFLSKISWHRFEINYTARCPCRPTSLQDNIDIKRKYRLLKVCYMPATSATFIAFFAAATNSTNETNKAGSTCY